MRARIVLTLLCSLVTVPALADQIRVGGVLVDSSSSVTDFRLVGAGFDLTGTAVGGNLQQCGPCVPGTPFTLSGLYDLEGTVELNGDARTAMGRLAFDSSSVFIPAIAVDELAALERAFTFVGTIVLDGSSMQRQLFGSGVATARFINVAGEGIMPVSIRYDLAAPVPEPASMLLFGSGLAAAALLRRRRRTAANGSPTPQPRS